MSRTLKTIGWREWVSFPDLGITHIKAKVDTGARSTCLHVASHQLFERDSKPWVRFTVQPLILNPEIEAQCEAPVLDMREVTDSGGHTQLRPFIQTTMHLAGQEYPLDLSLTNREGMKFRMLLGRVALAGHFLVDSASSYLLGKKPV